MRFQLQMQFDVETINFDHSASRIVSKVRIMVFQRLFPESAIKLVTDLLYQISSIHGFVSNC